MCLVSIPLYLSLIHACTQTHTTIARRQGGNCKTVMVATISPDESHTDESISTCNFAQRVALIKNVAQINEDLDPELIIRRLKTELNVLREEVKFLKGEAGEGYDLSDERREELQKLVLNYVDDRDIHAMLNIGTMTLTKIRDVYAIFKNLVLEARASGGGGSDGNFSNPELEKQVRILPFCIVLKCINKYRPISSCGGRLTNGLPSPHNHSTTLLRS